ncbi:MAG: response regulator [Treponema sp.]|jgi:two-component system response regulator YesN|nr:response regulator [Treponema sp.]
MYRVLLVDDEPWALAGLRKIFKWHEKQFEISGETTDSVEALDLIRRQKPDAVFTDIRMPEISGIELMKLIRGEGLDIEFIIISGFAEFSYAQESLRLGAFDFTA